MKFLKMHGLGNDFVILDQRSGAKKLDPAFIRQASDRHFGVGCDQLIVMEPSKKADLFMRIYNPDASEAEACGNATRCVAHLYMKEQGKDSCTVETVRGLLPCRLVAGDMVEVDMGTPLEIRDLELGAAGVEDPVSVNMGNPHCVFFVPDIGEINLESVGPVIENHPTFPNRTNVEFVQKREDGSLRVRVWERGAGVTLACGSGACAVAAAALHRGVAGDKVSLEMDGGILTLENRASDGHVLMTGPVAYVFEGVLT